MKKKPFAIVISLALILLTLALTPTSGQGGTYDPWLDYNEDGIINVNDLHPLGQTYGTSGDPTKNVNVTNWPLDGQGNLKVNNEPSYKLIHVWENYYYDWYAGGSSEIQTPRIDVSGYTTMHVYMRVANISTVQTGVTNISLFRFDWFPDATTPQEYSYIEWLSPARPVVRIIWGDSHFAAAKFDLQGPYVTLYLNLYAQQDDGNALFVIDAYLTH